MKIAYSFLISLLALCTFEAIAQDYVPFRENGKFGVKVLQSGEVLVKANYESVEILDGYFTNFALKAMGKSYFYDAKKRALCPIPFEQVGAIGEVWVTDSSKYEEGMDAFDLLTRKRVFPARYEDKWAFVGLNGENLVPFEFDTLTSYNLEGKAIAKKEGKYHLLGANFRSEKGKFSRLEFSPFFHEPVGIQAGQLVLFDQSGKEKLRVKLARAKRSSYEYYVIPDYEFILVDQFGKGWQVYTYGLNVGSASSLEGAKEEAHKYMDKKN